MNPWCRPVAEAKRERPTLVLLLGCGRDDAVALAVGAGCEEEGIPLVWERADDSADGMAREAAARSRLEVGIGMDGTTGAVTFAKYPSPEAYLRIEVEDLEAARWLGQAAARFVKSKPLPERFHKITEEILTEPLQEKGLKTEVRATELPKSLTGQPEKTEVSVPTDKDQSEAAVDRITQAVLEALRRQR